MTETPERPTETATGPVDTLPPPPESRRPNRLFQVAAWVAIVAGTVFVVGAVFFSGFFLGRHGGYGGDGGPGGWRDRDNAEFHQRMAPPMMPMSPGMGPGGPGMGPGGPGMGPGMAPGMGPGATTPVPTTTLAPRP